MQDKFRVDRLRLTDFRCFPSLDLALHPEVSVLVGPNGAGKSAVLDAIASGYAAGWTRGPVLQQADIRVELVPSARGRPERRPRPRAALDFDFTIEGGQQHLALWVEDGDVLGGPLLVPSAHIVVRYGADRLVTGAARLDDRAPPDLSDWWAPSLAWSSVITWFRRETLANLQHGTEGDALRGVERAIRDALGELGIDRVYYDIRTEDLRVVTGDVDVPFDVASGGVRALVALVVDLAVRTWFATPTEGEWAPMSCPGVVLVDEAELHLHPRWQRLVVPALRKAFPRLQLVISTHSPQVVGSVDAACVRILSPSGPAGVAHSLGRDTNSLLEDVFGDPGRAPEVSQRLHHLFEAIDRQDPAARQQLDAVEQELGTDDPDVARARFLLEMGF